MTKTRSYHGLPTRQEILDFIATSPTPVGKRDIVKAFKVRPADRVALKGLIKDIERAEPVVRASHRRLVSAETLPEIVVLAITGIDAQGDPICDLLRTGDEPSVQSPTIRLASVRNAPVPGVGQKIVARLRKIDAHHYQASPVRVLAAEADHVLAVFEAGEGGGGRLTPTDRRNKHQYRVRPDEALGATDGELVLALPLPVPRLGLPHAQIIERIGRITDPKAISLIAIHSHGIPVAFPEAALAEAAAAEPIAVSHHHHDLRHVPFITIDGADARDFDDAVWAEPTDGGGWRIRVAIADVSWYVRPGSALDKAAAERGNSVYFPDRVVPMLPEILSNELCSLKPSVDRACLAVELWLNADGEVWCQSFERGVMRSVARTTYEQVQAAMDGHPDAVTAPLLDTVIKPLYGAFAALDQARRKRGTLELDLPERRVVLGPDGTVVDVAMRERLDSHRLIEEFMIAANVAAAVALEEMKTPCMYRVHDTPSPEKLDALRTVLKSLSIDGLTLAKGQIVRPHHFNRVLAQSRARPEAAMINELVLRTQAQAAYSPENLGHFGLSLDRYAHFTSPIRRYADLLVHRALVAGLHLGAGGLPAVSPESFAETGELLSRLERRAALAERTAIDRYMVAYMADRRGAEFEARINGVTRFGLFVTILENGADGLIPMAALPRDYYHHDEAHHCLLGERSRRVYALGDRLAVQLVEINPVAGGLTFRPVTASPAGIESQGFANMPKPIPNGKKLKPRTKIAKNRRTARRGTA